MPIAAGPVYPRLAAIVVRPVGLLLEGPHPRRFGLDERRVLLAPMGFRTERRSERDDRPHGRGDDRSDDTVAFGCGFVTILVDVH
ncbi:hypothetical protein [Microbacterium sp. SYP-A9085]|uniref:hypothetical protein n=1 Tax=Microbacterium sp. SYP-A9085 TaxID=2664454 RepID=UPI0015629E77|nr:hypothetical protein [Microbacterium sp. SYP-A9085]